MKRVEYNNTNDDYMVVGTAREIKRLESRLRKQDRGILPLYTEPAKYNMDRMYAIDIYTDTYRQKWFTVLNSDTIVRMLADEEGIFKK